MGFYEITKIYITHGERYKSRNGTGTGMNKVPPSQYEMIQKVYINKTYLCIVSKFTISRDF